MRRVLIVFAVALLVAGCSGAGLFKAPPKLEIETISFEWDTIPTAVGRVVNAGGHADYIELAIKLTHPTDENHVYMTGWTNFASFGPGESRPFIITLTGERPKGEFRYHWRVSTTAGGAMY